ncbi:MAG: hypothetical protein E7404_08070 [Ruminococcaceae bacterium]|nr:hypothetical protein [Oscillospiraceae bacterium]
MKNYATYIAGKIFKFAELFGYNVHWNDTTKEVTIFDRIKYFKTIDDCAIDFYMNFNAMSIGIFREMGATVKKCDKGFYWDGVCIGNQEDIPEYKFDFDGAVAILHTHGGCGGAKNTISPKDRALAKKRKMPIYMCSPVGQCWKYYPEEKSIMFYDGAPVDLRCLKHLEKEGYRGLEKNVAKFNEYFPKYYDLKDEPYGHTADYYNKMFAIGEVYVLRADADE